MKKRAKPLLIICISFVLIYLIFAALPLSEELEFVPQWTVSSLSVSNDITTEDYNGAIPFKLGQNIGYFTKDGKILKNLSFNYKAAISNNYYTVYNASARSIEIFAPDGEKLSEIQSSGFPFFVEDKIFIFLPGGASFSSASQDGTINWTYEAIAPITSFSSSKAGTAVGLAEGTIEVLNHQGDTTFVYVPGGSKYPVILGVALSDTGKYVAAISGQEEQRFTLAQNDGGHAKILYHETMQISSTKQLLIKFSADEKYVFFDYEDGLGIVDIQSARCSHIPIAGHVISIKESPNHDLFFILSKETDEDKKTTYTVSTIEPFDNFAGAFSYKAENSFIEVQDDALFIGKDTYISKMQFMHR